MNSLLFSKWPCKIIAEVPCCLFMTATWLQGCGNYSNLTNFKPPYLRVVYFGEVMYGHGVGQCGRWTCLLQPFLCKIKVAESFYYTFEPRCLDVCFIFLQFIIIPFLRCYLWLEWSPIAVWAQCLIILSGCISEFINY
jgi:hypothetical protein